MNDKFLIKLIVPEIDSSFDLFIPTSEILWKVKALVIKSINDLTGDALLKNVDYVLINKTTNYIYPNNILVKKTDIRNATELILLSEKIKKDK